MLNEPREQLLRRIEGEYLEMPGLQLTREQAQRLWALDETMCVFVLDALVDCHFLARGSDDRYRRVSDGNAPGGRLRTAKANLAVHNRSEFVG
jgi:hypothetical protein